MTITNTCATVCLKVEEIIEITRGQAITDTATVIIIITLSIKFKQYYAYS